jgi:predicted CopG family antitoxin
MAKSADEQIRISEETKERLRRRKQEGESFEDVILQLLDEERDLLAGFGEATNRDGETLAETVARRKERSQHTRRDRQESES